MFGRKIIDDAVTRVEAQAVDLRGDLVDVGNMIVIAVTLLACSIVATGFLVLASREPR